MCRKLIEYFVQVLSFPKAAPFMLISKFFETYTLYGMRGLLAKIHIVYDKIIYFK